VVQSLLDDLVELTGAESVDYAERSLCCGMGYEHVVNSERRRYTREIATRKLLSIKETGAEAVIVACPGCQVTLDRNQSLIEKENNTSLNLPIINYAQLIALAMGADMYKIVGLQTHSVPVEPVSDRISASSI